MYKRPFVYDVGDLFLCPYCKGNLMLRVNDITDMVYDDHGVLDFDNNSYSEIEEIICTKCGSNLTDKTIFDTNTLTRRIDRSKVIKTYGKSYNPLYDEEVTYEL